MAASKAEGRLPDVKLIFPNIEIRFAVGTGSGAALNAHLLISPEASDHVEQTRRFLSTLTFRAHDETHQCTHEGLIALGRAHDSDATDDRRALEVGANQFKTTLEDLRKAIQDSKWARENILIAVAAATGSGTSGLNKDASMEATRREIERTADVIFTGNPEDRAFWLGEKSDTLEQLREKYDGAKPCMHGSDAHHLDAVCAPDQERYTWIKGDATFEALRQALIEPGARAFVGKAPPEGALPYRVIRSIKLKDADWCSHAVIELNPGLIGIIGARGSGKTALADLIATGAGSPESRANKQSFISRAADHLSGVEITLVWADGETQSIVLGSAAGETSEEAPGVQYLSQQFVERLCSPESGVSDELLAEIERVILEEHPAEERLGATSFGEMLEKRAARSRAAQARSRDALERAVARMSEERRKHAELAELRRRKQIGDKIVAEDRKARSDLISKGVEERAKRLEQIQAALEKRQVELDIAARRRQAIGELGDLVDDVHTRRADAELAELVRTHRDAELSESDWQQFRRDFGEDVDSILKRLREDSDRVLARLRGEKVSAQAQDAPYVDDDADLTKVAQIPLAQEAERLRDLIGIDHKKSEQLRALDRKIAQAEATLSQLAKQIEEAEGSEGRIDALKAERKAEYGKVFDGLVEEEEELTELYAPLAERLKSAEGALSKLTFQVRREVDVAAWAAAGEKLLDLRTAGPFKGHGALLEASRKELLPAWRSGSSAEVSDAMAKFRDAHDQALLEHSPVPPAERENYWQWAAQVANWLDQTSHIRIRYGIQYDGVEIEQLSPGTRGIVLLLLYLSIDQSDDRPLIIDQPEENLDPKSVFDELVKRFREARMRRQMIVVTHNANLIVNTDADQVIVASAGPHRTGGLPEISYESGGLEDPEIRRQVCEILEGGQQAFTERARRLRVRLPRRP
ncbi:MAG TPA: AAA family ATPase [Solirubrobacterales bacterium]|nr:AAA family ATPase [Solirubrobacterales bacterium]